MHSEKAQLALLDIQDNIVRAKRFTSGYDLERFIADDKTFYAVIRCLEIVSEASRRLPEDLRRKYPSLPRKEIMGVGNIYRHNYDNVQQSIVWATLQTDLEPLLSFAVSELVLLDKAKSN